MPDDLLLDFVFVPNGAPWPADWVQRHPDYISLPARFKGTPAQMRRMFGKYQPVPVHNFFQKAKGDDGANVEDAPAPGGRPTASLPAASSGLPIAIGGGVSAWTCGAVLEDLDALPKVERQSIRDAVVKALDLIEPGVEHSPNVRLFTGEFAQIVDPAKLGENDWLPAFSLHADKAVEHQIPGFPDYVVKFYPDDSHGPNMVVITRRTLSLLHVIDAAFWYLNVFNNSLLSHEFCASAAGCGPYPVYEYPN